MTELTESTTRPRGTVYGGVLYWPQHPAADMHGLVRACVRTQSRLQILRLIHSYGLQLPASAWLTNIWGESRSVVEGFVTEQHYGALLVCPLSMAYLSAENYQAGFGALTLRRKICPNL